MTREEIATCISIIFTFTIFYIYSTSSATTVLLPYVNAIYIEQINMEDQKILGKINHGGMQIPVAREMIATTRQHLAILG